MLQRFYTELNPNTDLRVETVYFTKQTLTWAGRGDCWPRTIWEWTHIFELTLFPLWLLVVSVGFRSGTLGEAFYTLILSWTTCPFSRWLSCFGPSFCSKTHSCCLAHFFERTFITHTHWKENSSVWLKSPPWLSAYKLLTTRSLWVDVGLNMTCPCCVFAWCFCRYNPTAVFFYRLMNGLCPIAHSWWSCLCWSELYMVILCDLWSCFSPVFS